MAELELLEQLEQLVIRNVAFAHGTVVAMYGGVLLYSVDVLQAICQACSGTRGGMSAREKLPV